MSETDIPSNLPEGNTSIIKESNVASLLWLEATDPTLLTPMTLEKGGMASIIFYNSDGKIVVDISRFINLIGQKISIQDEVRPSNENLGGQFNYTIIGGEVTEYNSNPNFDPIKQKCVDLIKPLVGQKGSRLLSRHKDYLEPGFYTQAEFVSDGIQWINGGQKQSSASLNEGQLQLDSNK